VDPRPVGFGLARRCLEPNRWRWFHSKPILFLLPGNSINMIFISREAENFERTKETQT
jgi:hypothetical protein